MVKIAMYFIYNEVLNKGLENHIKLFVQVHDEIAISATEEYVEVATDILGDSMAKAAKLILGNELLTLDVQVTDYWDK